MAAATEIGGAGEGLPAMPGFEALYQQCYERSVRLAWLLAHEARVKRDAFSAAPQEWAQWCRRELPRSRVALLYGPPLTDFSAPVRRDR